VHCTCAEIYQIFKCNYANVARAFYHSFNAIFGHLSHSASVEVVLYLINMKCLPFLFYGIEACPINVTGV